MFIKLIKEPLVHFLLLGGVIFLLYGWRQGPAPAGDEIFISSSMQQNMADVFQRTWRRPPSEAELQGLIQDRIRQELAYREARVMHLDDDDIIVRRRLRQKLEMLTEDVATAVPATDAQLNEWYQQHTADFLVPAHYTVRQLYFKLGQNPERAEQRAVALLEGLQRNTDDAGLAATADPILLPALSRDATAADLASTFGQQFAEAVVNAEPGEWSGPVASGFGLHLIRVEQRREPRDPALAKVRQQVEREWLAQRQASALDAYYAKLAERYAVVIEPAAN